MGIAREQALKIYWQGEERLGLLLYGLRRPGQPPRVDLAELVPDPEMRLLQGQGWAVEHWTIRLARVPAADHWRAWLEQVLDRLLQAGYEVAWFALEGDFVDPPELFGQARSTSVYAAASRDTGFICHDAGEDGLRFLTRDDIARLREPAMAAWLATLQNTFQRRLHAVVARLDPVLTSDQRDVIEHLIDHAEGGEAMLTLAWILVEGGKRVPASAIAEIRELADGLVDDSDFPPDLDAISERP